MSTANFQEAWMGEKCFRELAGDLMHMLYYLALFSYVWE
jgi:hypothetical protein